jgi:hypothetical protein
MNFTPLDQAYQVHHGNPTMYVTNKIQTINPKCVFCGNTNTFPLMEKQDGGIFRQCINQLCRKQFNSGGQVHNWQFKDNNTIFLNQEPIQQKQPIQPKQQIQPIEPQIYNPYLPQEPNFITRFNTNTK